MAKFNIAFDQADAELGQYFLACKEDISAYIEVLAIHVLHEMSSDKCNTNYIDDYFPTINNEKFVFVAYTHGNHNCLTCAGNWFINSPINTHNFVNSFFYAMSCHTAKNMGPELILRGCLAFIGYNNTAYALKGDNQKISVDCDNKGLKTFIAGGTLGEAYIEMKLFFKESIRSLLANRQLIAAGALRSNLAALKIYGNENIKFGDF